VRFHPPLGALVAASIAVGAPPSRAQTAGAPPAAAPPAVTSDAAPALPGPPGGGEAPPDAAPADEAPAAAAAPPAAPSVALAAKPPPLHVEYAQYGVALTAEMNLDAGATCRDEQPGGGFVPCILGSGGGLSIRGGYRSPGPWYFGGAYEFTKMDSSNLYRLGIFQQLRAEMRYLPDIGYRAAPYFVGGVGGVAYGNEWGVETGGALLSVGAGVEMEISRLAVLGLSIVYRPVLLAGWTDTAGHQRDTAIAQFLGLEFLLEVRTELGRR
jgi:hypothetical protein